MDTATQVAIFGFLGTLVAAALSAFVALRTNKTEKTTAAETTMEATLRERIALRDEQLADEKDRVDELETQVARLEASLAIALVENERLKK